MQADGVGIRTYTLVAGLEESTYNEEESVVYSYDLDEPILNHNVDPDLSKDTVLQVCCSRFTVAVDTASVEGDYFGVGLRGLGVQGYLPTTSAHGNNILSFGTAVQVSAGTAPYIYAINKEAEKTWFDVNVNSQIQQLEMFVFYIKRGESKPGQPPALSGLVGEFQFRTGKRV